MEEVHSNSGKSEATQPPTGATWLNAEWLAGLNHELRSPLTTIQGYSSMLLRHEDQLSSEERQDFLRMIYEGSNRMADILDRFLELANLEAGTIHLQRTTIDIVDLAEEVARKFQHVIRQDHTAKRDVHVSVRTETQRTSPLMVMEADRTLLRRMLFLLLENAWKYSLEEAAIEIVVSSYTLPQQQTMIPHSLPEAMRELAQSAIELQIKDNGVGIAAAHYEYIFERFQRVDATLTRTIPGLGLGLTTCKHIVTLHQGTIWVESTPGKGSTFHILLPTHENRQKRM